MECYQELTILPAPEMPANFILGKVYQQLHLAFVGHQSAPGQVPYGVSFPEYQEQGEQMGLGGKIRIFAPTQAELEQLNLEHVLQRYADYVHIKRPRRVPPHVKGYSSYCRYHQEASRAQKARRYARRHGMDAGEAMHLFPLEQRYEYPYVQMQSSSNGHKFRLYVHKVVQDTATDGFFSVYGLSSQATLPEF